MPNHPGIDDELLEAAREVLRDDECLSSFIHKTLRSEIVRRHQHRRFVQKAMAAEEEAKRSGRYVPASQVVQNLQNILLEADGRRRQPKRD